MSVSGQNVLVLDQQGIQIFSMMGIWLKMIKAVFSLETSCMSVLYPFVYVSSICDGVLTFEIEQE